MVCYQEHEVQPLLEFSDGVAETAVSIGGVYPTRIANVAANAARAAAVGAHVPDKKASSCTGRLPPDACRAGSAPSGAGALAFSPRCVEPR